MKDEKELTEAERKEEAEWEDFKVGLRDLRILFVNSAPLIQFLSTVTVALIVGVPIYSAVKIILLLARCFGII